MWCSRYNTEWIVDLRPSAWRSNRDLKVDSRCLYFSSWIELIINTGGEDRIQLSVSRCLVSYWVFCNLLFGLHVLFRNCGLLLCPVSYLPVMYGLVGNPWSSETELDNLRELNMASDFHWLKRVKLSYREFRHINHCENLIYIPTCRYLICRLKPTVIVSMSVGI